MTNQNSREFLYFKVPVFVIDLCIYYAVMFMLLRYLPMEMVDVMLDGTSMPLTPFGLVSVSFAASIGMIHLKLHERRIKAMVVIKRALFQTLTTLCYFTVLCAFVYKNTPRWFIVYQLLYTIPLITIFHFASNKFVRLLRHSGHNTRHVVIIGIDETTVALYKELLFGNSFSGYQVFGFFSSSPNYTLPQGGVLLGRISDFYDWIQTNRPDEIYCSLSPASSKADVNKIIQICNDKFIEFFFVPTFDGYPQRQLAIRSIGKVNYIKLREEPLNSPFAKIIKRTFDILLSGIFLAVFFPFVVLFVWIGNKLGKNSGPLFFRQVRTGYNGSSFRIFKFRSMKQNADADILQATENDPRKTPFGDFLRRSSIDELPQFINVLLGEMSIVGPRPHMEHHTQIYSELIGNYMVRHLAKPGISGWAQINGCRGETKTLEEMADRVVHDIWYIEHWTLFLDIDIILKTIWQVMPGHDKQAY